MNHDYENVAGIYICKVCGFRFTSPIKMNCHGKLTAEQKAERAKRLAARRGGCNKCGKQKSIVTASAKEVIPIADDTNKAQSTTGEFSSTEIKNVD